MTATLEELNHFVSQFADDGISRELVLFFGKHPCARFSQLVLRSALAMTADIAPALRCLTDRSVLQAVESNGVSLYRLTDEEPIRGLVLRIAAMDFRERRRFLSGVPGATVTPALAYARA